MTKIDIFSGFLGAGKTTLIRKLIAEAYAGQSLVLIENEFGEIGVDGAFMQDAGVAVTEMNSGCICCSLSGDFSRALRMVMEQFHPDRILIEPSGVGKLSDVVDAVEKAETPDMVINGLTTVADAGKCRVYMKNFGEFYRDQLKSSSCIVLSRTGNITPEKLAQALALIREANPDASVVTTPWEQLSGAQILEAMERRDTLDAAITRLKAEALEDGDACGDEDCCCHHHHEDGETCSCGHHHHEDDDDDDHDHDDDDDHGHHHGHAHHHDEDDEHDHGEHEHHHHHGHDADEIFASWGVETARRFTEAELNAALDALEDEAAFGQVLRAKGIVAGPDGVWYHFDYVPGEKNIREGAPAVTGRLCVIGARLNEQAAARLFIGE